jgi:hypothetical protein
MIRMDLIVRLLQFVWSFLAKFDSKNALDPDQLINQSTLSSFLTSIRPINRFISNNSIKIFSIKMDNG